jgi:hypothetical protein
LLLPLHKTFVAELVVTESEVGSVIIIESDFAQPLASVVVTTKVSAQTLLIEAVVTPPGCHKYVNGAVPVNGVTAADPEQTPLQFKPVELTEVATLVVPPTNALRSTAHPPESVIVTE